MEHFPWTLLMYNGLSLKNINRRAEEMIAASKKAAEVGVIKNSYGVDRKGRVSKISAAEIAAINAHGTLAKGGYIPPRDYQTAALNANRAKYKKLIKKFINNNISATAIFNLIGQMAVSDQKKAIRDMIPRNAPSTVKKKGKDSPLFDTGHLVKSLTYRVVDNDN